MVRYFYSWTPLVIVGSVVLLALPWLGLFALAALLTVSVVVLGVVVSAIVAVPYALAHAVSRRWHDRRSARPRTASLFAGGASARLARDLRAATGRRDES
jgi:hypothetical protein